MPYRADVSIAAQFSAELDKAGQEHLFQVEINVPTGPILAQTEVPLNLPSPDAIPADWEEIAVVTVINFQGIPFEEEGWHRFRFGLDGEPLDEIRLRSLRAMHRTRGRHRSTIR